MFCHFYQFLIFLYDGVNFLAIFGMWRSRKCNFLYVGVISQKCIFMYVGSRKFRFLYFGVYKMPFFVHGGLEN